MPHSTLGSLRLSPMLLSLVVAALAALALLPSRRRDRFCDPAVAVIAALLAWVFARTALLVLVDASSFPARSSRYVYPALALYGCALLLLVEQGVRNLRGTRSRRAVGDAPPESSTRQRDAQ